MGQIMINQYFVSVMRLLSAIFVVVYLNYGIFKV